MDCAQLADVAPELALGVLTGHERAEALEHLDSCSACRQLVNSLSGVTDELLRSFVPSVQPSAGFEDRVLAAIAPVAPVTKLPVKRRGMVGGLAAAACVALVIALAIVVGPSSRPAVAAAQMRTGGGEAVGWIYLDHQDPAAVYMSLPGWSEQIERYGSSGASYSLHLTTRTGPERVLPVTLDAEAAWKATLDIDPATITAAELIDDHGHTWCHADLTAT